MTKLYSTTNPQAIIDVFEQRAKIADGGVSRASTRAAKESYRSEAITWRAAADILRNTEFVGWNVVDEATRNGEEMDKHGMFDYSADKED
jgi:hypothetical protein